VLLSRVAILFVVLLGSSLPLRADRADAHAPIGVMGDHTHEAGSWMLSYRFMTMAMSGHLEGTRPVPLDEVLRSGTGDYMVAPREMPMTMQMLGLMFAPTDAVTLMVMLPVLDYEMSHVTAMGGQFETDSSGLGDVGLSALIPVTPETHVGFGVSAPTGSIDETGLTPMGNVVLPYPMQPGSGTWDLTMSLTTGVTFERGRWGVQTETKLRTGTNDADYTLGNVYSASTWYSVNREHRSYSVRLDYKNRRNIRGEDRRLAAARSMSLVPTVDPRRRGGERVDLLLGINGATGGPWRWALEVGYPVFQSLDGPQLETNWLLTGGLQWMP